MGFISRHKNIIKILIILFISIGLALGLAFFAIKAVRYYQAETEKEAQQPLVTYRNLYINTTPADAQIFVDGKDTGKNTPAVVTSIPDRNVEIKLVKDEYQEYKQSIDFSSFTQDELTIELTANENSAERERKVNPFKAYVRKAGISLYSGDSVNSSWVATLARSEELNVTGISRANGWYHVTRSKDRKVGWVTADPNSVQRRRVYVYKYKNPDQEITKLRIKAIYFAPKDKPAPANWKQLLEWELKETKIFVEREFHKKVTLNYTIYPEPVYGSNDCQKYTEGYQSNDGYSSYYGCGIERGQGGAGYSFASSKIYSELNGVFYKEGGKYYDKNFLTDNPNEATSYGVFGFGYMDLGIASFEKNFMSLSYCANVSSCDVGTGIGTTIHEFLHTLGIPDQYSEGTVQRSCPALKEGKKVNYGCIMQSIFWSPGAAEDGVVYLDSEIKSFMGLY